MAPVMMMSADGLVHAVADLAAGVEDGVRDALTRYTTPLTGAYYVIPPVNALRGFSAGPE